MGPDVESIAWAIVGNVVIGVGAGTATLAAFAPGIPFVDASNPAVRVGVVSAGFALFFAGYRLTQSGTYRNPEEPLSAAFLPSSETIHTNSTQSQNSGGASLFMFLRGVFVVIGVVGLGAGMRLFALTIQTWSGTLGIATGTVCILGYIFGHIGMNGVAL